MALLTFAFAHNIYEDERLLCECSIAKNLQVRMANGTEEVKTHYTISIWIIRHQIFQSAKFRLNTQQRRLSHEFILCFIVPAFDSYDIFRPEPHPEISGDFQALFSRQTENFHNLSFLVGGF